MSTINKQVQYTIHISDHPAVMLMLGLLSRISSASRTLRLALSRSTAKTDTDENAEFLIIINC